MPQPQQMAQQQAEDPYPLRRLLYSHPDSAYGHPDSEPVQEEMEEQPASSHNSTLGGFISSAFGSLFGSAGRSAKR